MAELILYALPTGPLATAMDAFAAGVHTEAQRYPHHCTLTGFFHDDDVARYLDAAAAVVEPCAVRVVRLRAETGDWIGLELSSPDLLALTERFAALVAEPRTRTDAIRPKTWLHASLAYGHDPRQHPSLAARALHLVDPGAPCGWDLSLLERRPRDVWREHGRWELAASD